MQFIDTLTGENKKSYQEAYFVKQDPTKSYFISGKAGIGKTFLALQLIKEELRLNPVKSEFISNLPNPDSENLAPDFESTFFEFVKAQDIIQIARQQYSDHATEKHEAKMAIKGWKSREVLIIDDLGAENTTEFAKAVLFDIIDYRHDRKDQNQTIITSNVKLEDLVKTYSDRTTSRIKGMCEMVQFQNKIDLRNVNKIHEAITKLA